MLHCTSPVCKKNPRTGSVITPESSLVQHLTPDNYKSLMPYGHKTSTLQRSGHGRLPLFY